MSDRSRKLNSQDSETMEELDKRTITEDITEESNAEYLKSVDTQAVTIEAFAIEDSPLYMMSDVDSDNVRVKTVLASGEQEFTEDTIEKSTVKEINPHIAIEKPGVVKGKFKQTVKHYLTATVQQMPTGVVNKEVVDKGKESGDEVKKDYRLLGWFGIVREKLGIKGLRFLIIWLVLFILLVFLLGFWSGRHSVFEDFSDLDITLEDPILVSDTVVTMSGMNWDYLQSDSYNPNDKYNQIYFGAQLFAADDYIVYISDDKGEQYHTTLAQCKLVVNDEDINDVHIKFFKGVDHPFIVFNMDSSEFVQNVGAEFMPNYTDAMRYFVYQYLAETLPFSNSTKEN